MIHVRLKKEILHLTLVKYRPVQMSPSWQIFCAVEITKKERKKKKIIEFLGGHLQISYTITS